ncbi:MAG TPA: RNA repair transcriptional activator RtcR [Steroidobacter sp.]|uniref:RNA repair transcriptional activator RtcR n=1 Tax=Steroidobacter sp. TaxID=1978227 RepID=UPI002ED9F239
MKTVVIGFLGSILDSGGGPGRWEKWRPSVSICQHDDLVIDRFEMLHSRGHIRLAEQLRTDIASVSPETKVNLHVCDPANPWDFQEVYGCLHEFARQYPFDLERERYLIHITTGTHVAQICMFLLTEARYFPAVLLQTSPPRKQGSGDAGAYSLIDLDLSRYNQIGARFAREKQESTEFLKSGIKTRNAAFNQMIARIERVAVRSKAPLMLNGPTGAGKSTLARRIYELKKSRHQIQGEFVEVNCATLRGDAALSTLFGHVKGAFTGALSDRAGLLRKAHGGVVFLDEIGELGIDEQTMLLKAIEEKRFSPMGSDKEVESDFQLIAGTNRDLRLAVAEGKFRDDLLARINLWVFELPALRDRREDVEPNIDYELDRFARDNDVTVRFNAEARKEYQRFATSPAAVWSGNFRELSASIMRMATLAEGGRITTDVVEDEIERLQSTWRPKPSQSNLESLLPAKALAEIDLFDRLQLDVVIEMCRSCATMAEAGRKLFAASRTRRRAVNDSDRLKKYLARFNLDWAALKH